MRKSFKIVALVTVVAAFTSCRKEPVASFTVASENVESMEEVQFTNTSENGVTYLWDFGDGITSTDESPKHKYNIATNFFFGFNDITQPYSYNVTLKAYSKKEKKKHEYSKVIYVKDAKAKFIGNYLGSQTKTYGGNTTTTSSVYIDITNDFFSEQLSLNCNSSNAGSYTVYVTVEGANITIPRQTISDYFTDPSVYSGSASVTGSGTITGNTINIVMNSINTSTNSTTVINYTGTK